MGRTRVSIFPTHSTVRIRKSARKDSDLSTKQQKMGLKAQLTSILILLSIAEANNNINDLFGDDNNEDMPCWERGVNQRPKPDLEFNIPLSTRLHADPGETYRAEFLLTKNTREEFTTILSYREKYELDRGNRMPHMQIVGQMEPTVIHSMAENETQRVYLTIEVPKYASEWRRFEISLDALTHNPRVQKVASDASNEEQDGGSQHFQTSFHFTISKNGSLEELDEIGPDCDQNLVKLKGLKDCEQVNEHNCTESCWSADFNVRDNVTGLRSVYVEDDNVTLSYDPAKLVEGMNSKRGLRTRIVASCCLEYVEVEAMDVAGNFGVCRVGKIDSGSAKLDSSVHIWVWIPLIIFKYNCAHT